MEEIYVKENKIFELTQKESEQELIRSIIEAKRNLEIAHNNFEYAEKDLIDYYTYQIKANSSKIDYLTKLAKSKGIIVSLEDKIKISSAI